MTNYLIIAPVPSLPLFTGAVWTIHPMYSETNGAGCHLGHAI